MKSWYSTERILSVSEVVKRPQLANIELQASSWTKLFFEIAEQREPGVRLLEADNMVIDIDGVVWLAPNKISVEHHEYSEQRVVMQRLMPRPTIRETFFHPRVSAGKYYRWLKRKAEGVKYGIVPDDNPVLYFSDNRAQINFYHWMIDSLSRLVMAQPWIKNSYLLITEEQLKRDYVLASLELLGFRKEQIIPIRKDIRYKVKKLQIVTCSIFAPGACSSTAVKIIQKHLSLPTEKPDKLIYLARKPTLGRGIANIDDFNAVLEKFGVLTVYPENLTFDDLRKLLGEAKLLIGVYSAALTHAIFLHRKSNVIELASNKYITPNPSYWEDKYPSQIAGDCYYALSSACDLKHHLIPCTQINDQDYVLQSDIVVDIDLLTKTLNKIICDDYK